MNVEPILNSNIMTEIKAIIELWKTPNIVICSGLKPIFLITLGVTLPFGIAR